MLILKAIVDDYIKSMEPVGSRTIAKKYDMGLSSATIRNEMADLEEMGYLSQPHTSAGRIPSDKGYRLYVDRMIRPEEQSFREVERLAAALEARIGEFNQLIKTASDMISQMTQYTSIAMASASRRSAIKALQIVPVETGRVLVIVVMGNDVIKNQLISIDSSISPELLIRLSHIVNEKFTGCPADQISMMMINEIVRQAGVERAMLLPIVDGILDCIKQCETTEVFTSGASNLLCHPEFNDIEKARSLLDLLHNEAILTDLLEQCADAGGLVIRIGAENELNEINECSVVTATYSVNNTSVGTIGVLGPTRMDYSKVISSLEYVRKQINRRMAKLLTE